MSVKIILLNGPPGSGKDTIGKILENRGLAARASFKDRLFDIALLTSGVNKEDWFERYNDRALKEEPWDRLGGLSQRQFMIKVSEEWLKPTFGEQYFGLAAVEAIEKIGNEISTVFTDSGFPEETQVLIDHGYDVFIIQLYRDGYTFFGDSRNYLQGFEKMFRLDLINGDPDIAVDQISEIVWKN